jgi:CubicO group peptidase (beta-lactamase class C family)
VLLFTAGSCVFAQQPQQDEFAPLTQYIDATMKDWKVPGVAVGIVRGSSPVYLKGFGVRNIQTRQPITPDTLFDIGSCTKAFTGASIAMLVDERKMNWDDKVDKSIPFFHLYDPLADENVTLRDLLVHRTGLPGADLLWYGASFSREDIVRRLAYIQPDAGFRSVFQYQNAMYVTLGYAVGSVSGGSWDDFVRQRIFTPLGMTESDTSAIDAQKSADYASPHSLRDGKLQVVPWKNIDNAGPAGSINSSVRDMAKWIALQMNDGVFQGKRLISSDSMREMHTPQIVVPPGEVQTVFFPDSMQLSYGFGWFIQDYRGHQLMLHPGDIDGFEALTVFIPEIHTGYEVLVNVGGNSFRQALGYHIADVLLHLPEKDWSAHFQAQDAKFATEEKATVASWESKRNPNTNPSHELNAYAGSYMNPAYGIAAISVDSGHLAFRFHDVTSPLRHFQYDTFVTDLDSERGDPTRITFSQDSGGDISGFILAGIHFQRSQPATPAVPPK